MLYELQHQQIALNIIQHLIKLEIEYDPKYKIFFTRLNQIFYHSRRLLTVTMAPQIIKQYINDNIGQEIAFQIIAFKDESKKDFPNHHICRFMVNNGGYICEFLRKVQGIFFGSIVKIKTKDGNLLKRYYLKAYEGYPAVNQKNSQQSYADATILYTSTNSQNRPTTTPYKLDLREPFVYKVLEQLGYGPNVHFFVNPYIN